MLERLFQFRFRNREVAPELFQFCGISAFPFGKISHKVVQSRDKPQFAVADFHIVTAVMCKRYAARIAQRRRRVQADAESAVFRYRRIVLVGAQRFHERRRAFLFIRIDLAEHIDREHVGIIFPAHMLLVFLRIFQPLFLCMNLCRQVFYRFVL